MTEFTGPSANYIRQQVTIALRALDPLEKLGTDVAMQGLSAVIEECDRRMRALPVEEAPRSRGVDVLRELIDATAVGVLPGSITASL
jgi:hypothetical protein